MKKIITWILDGVRFAGLFLACCWYSLVCGGEIAAEEAEIEAEEAELAAGGAK
jgi:hypothetical protein